MLKENERVGTIENEKIRCVGRTLRLLTFICYSTLRVDTGIPKQSLGTRKTSAYLGAVGANLCVRP
jgi:hypothetical protein